VLQEISLACNIDVIQISRNQTNVHYQPFVWLHWPQHVLVFS